MVPSLARNGADPDDDDDEDSSSNPNAVTCGSVIKIQHVDTGYLLHSETKSLNSGSGQQIVTFVAEPGQPHTLWWLRPAHHGVAGREYGTSKATCQLARPVRCGTNIRLTHLPTMRNLHSHAVESVLSRQQEVTAYGEGDGQGDGGDDWKVLCLHPQARYWNRNEPVRFQHQDTGKFLGTSKTVEFNQNNCGSHCPLMNHLESFGRAASDSYSIMKVEQGVHLSH